ncbi:MAG: VOC family protein [Chthoniobacterales bacterium]|nr:VOC family protein [Chthoniobacterales bacterium]
MAIAKQKIVPFLWFDTQAEDAVQFYLSVFESGQVTATTRYGPEGPGAAGSVMTIAFELEGQQFVGLNGGPNFKFNEAVSFVVNCETQQEIDHYWGALTADGGQPIQCGWLKDKYGLAWQIVPVVFWELIQSSDAARVSRVMQAMMQMQKFDIAALERAAAEQ